MLENKVLDIIDRIKEVSKNEDIVLLDYETNCDVLDPKKPLSHAYLVKSYCEGNYPKAEDLYLELKRRKLKPQKESSKENNSKSNIKKVNPRKDNNQTTLF